MNAFQKAKRRVEQLTRGHGCPPQEIVLTRYRSRADFECHKPGEDYTEHLIQRAQLVEWLLARGIKVIDDDVSAAVPTRPTKLAETAYRQKASFRKGDPYRLGLSIGTNYEKAHSHSAIGWIVLGLGQSESGEE